MTLVTPRIVNNVSCVNRINDECYFAWQAEYLVSLGHASKTRLDYFLTNRLSSFPRQISDY